MGQLLCQIVLPFHALTGCDTTSAFANKGKKMPWELIKSSPMKYGKLCDIGSSPVNETYPVVKDFILNMYQPYNSKLNQTVSACKDIRYKLFAAKGCRLKDLPPTEDALMQHLKRVDYQVKIWKASLEAKPIFPCPISTGAWHVDESLKLVPTYITTEPVPERILQIVKCSCCSKSRCAKTCTCLKQGLPCTDACQCFVPENIRPGMFTQVAADNADFREEETLDGKNTTHSTTIVLFQRKPSPHTMNECDQGPIEKCVIGKKTAKS